MTGYDFEHFVKMKQKERLKYKPTEKQVRIARFRILGAFNKFHGYINAVNRKELLVILQGCVVNRGNQLGDRKKGQFKVVVNAALDQLLAEDSICEANGQYGLMKIKQSALRNNRQKYPSRRHRSAA